ncbi:MAG: hypothetical protein V3V28_12525 [Polaribacter sp.]|uniref:hypothetical protein n=1 Tax=Polaribacter sp. TaxID=1920175 RepID=UPI002F35E1B0
MKIKIENVNIKKVIFLDENYGKVRKSSPHPDWLFPGILHNLLLQQIYRELPSLNIKKEKAQSVIKKIVIELNERLELGFDNDKIFELNVLPPNGDYDMYEYFKRILKNGGTGPFNPSPESNIIEGCINVLEIFEKNKENMSKSVIELKTFYTKNIHNISDKEKFTSILSIAYHSAKLYSKKDNIIKLLNISNDKEEIEKISSINWWKVAGCDAVGGFFGLVPGAAVASSCSYIMQL